MSSAAPRPSPAGRHALAAPREAGAIFATRRGEPITLQRFMHDVRRTAQALPEARHVLNFCVDRYRFAVVFCAAVTRGQVTLLPPTTTPNVIAAMRSFAPDVFYVSDDDALEVDLPRSGLPADDGSAQPPLEIPQIAADQLVACLFTSGSTGEPQPHFKTWGGLVQDMAAEARC